MGRLRLVLPSVVVVAFFCCGVSCGPLSRSMTVPQHDRAWSHSMTVPRCGASVLHIIGGGLPQVSRVCSDKRQKYACHEKHIVVAKKKLLRQNTSFSRQKYACREKHDKLLSRQKYFAAINIILSRQNFSRGKHTFVATKDDFVATNTCFGPSWPQTRRSSTYH